jgi:hypothetical protein
MNKLERLPGNVLRITRVIPNAKTHVRLIPSNSIVCVTVYDTSIHIDYTHDLLNRDRLAESPRGDHPSCHRLEFPTKELLNFNATILAEYLGNQPFVTTKERGAKYWSQPASDYPLLE